MAHALGSTPVRLNVAITSYLLSVAVFVPVSGWAADRYGARRIYLVTGIAAVASGLLFAVFADGFGTSAVRWKNASAPANWWSLPLLAPC